MQLIQTVSTYPSFQCAFSHMQGKVAKLGASIRSYLPEQISSSDRALSKIAIGALALANLVFIVSIVLGSEISLLAGMAIGSALAVIGTLCGLAQFSAPSQEEMRRQFLQAAHEGQLEHVYWFLGAGMDRDVNWQDSEGRTALIAAAYRGHTATVETLIARGADAQTQRGSRALIAAASRGHTATVETLIARGADIHAQTQRGSTALIMAAIEGHTATVEALIARGANIHAQTQHGTTALIIAAWSGHTATVETLIARGADIHAQTLSGSTALIMAAIEGHTATVEALIARGANIHAQTQSGETAQDIARQRGYTALADAIPTWAAQRTEMATTVG